jgi:hypothetical protein
MEPTLLSVLARFKGNRQQALDYCIETAMRYPNLSEEYAVLAEKLMPEHYRIDHAAAGGV